MGSAGMRFGRNVPLSEAFPDTANLMNPSPRRVSLELLTRTTFQPATILNVHRRGVDPVHGARLVRAQEGHAGRTPTTSRWTMATAGTSGRCACRRRRRIRRRSPTRSGRRPTSTRTRTGGTARTSTAAAPSAQASLRAGREGKVLVSPSGRLGVDPVTGPRDHRLHRERLGGPEPAARAVRARAQRDLRRAEEAQSALGRRAAVPAGAARQRGAAREDSHRRVVDGDPAEPRSLATGLRTNWYGRFSKLQNVFPKLADNDIFSGIPGSPTEHHGAPFSLTEEFVSVYRMHTLMPDHFTIRSAETGEALGECRAARAVGTARRRVPCALRPGGSLLLVRHPPSRRGAAAQLSRSPCRTWCRTTASASTSAPIDILRDRERGVPRYNRFRRLLHKPPVTSFEELTDNPQWAEEIKRVYNNDLEMVDTMVGLMAEPLPRGLRLQRHRVPHLPADGVAAAEERSVPVAGLSPGDLHASRASTGSKRTR